MEVTVLLAVIHGYYILWKKDQKSIIDKKKDKRKIGEYTIAEVEHFHNKDGEESGRRGRFEGGFASRFIVKIRCI